MSLIYFKCHFCNRSYTDCTNYYADIKCHFRLIPNFVIKCGYPRCNQYNFTKFEGLKHHMKRMHSNVNNIRSLQSFSSNVFLKCPQCGLVLSMSDISRFKNHYIEHLKHKEIGELECLFDECTCKFTNETTFQCHIRKYHKNSSQAVKQHLKEHDNEATIESEQNVPILSDEPIDFNEAQPESNNLSLNLATSVNFNFDKQMNDAYMSLYLNMNQIFQIPKYQCDAIFRDFAFLQDTMINKYRFDIKNAVTNYGFDDSVSQIMGHLVETSNSYLRAHDHLKFDSKKVNYNLLSFFLVLT
jgi:hypothetical protein